MILSLEKILTSWMSDQVARHMEQAPQCWHARSAHKLTVPSVEALRMFVRNTMTSKIIFPNKIEGCPA
jgi:hypothetical protein